MIEGRVLLTVKRFRQRPAECAIATVSSLARYYDKSVEYDDIREMIPFSKRHDGLTTWQECTLLNKLGFNKVSVVTFDQELVDFSWSKLSKKGLIRKLKKLRAHYGRCREPYYKKFVNEAIKWLEDKDNDNNVIIDNDLPFYIKREINEGRPVGACFNWTSIFKFTKSPARRGLTNGEFGGNVDTHAVVIRGYDDKGIFVVDSHHEKYKGKLKKYKNGYYKLSWENFLVNVSMGDLILVDYEE